ncbi:hypothetical protein COBT_001985 [Conglomerata obtusa]
MFQRNVDITQLHEKLYIVGQCWKNRTEIFSERNNIYELYNHLDNLFPSRYLIWRFDQKDEEKVFANVVLNRLPEYSIKMALNVSKGVKAWFHLNRDNVCVIECKGNLQKFIFIVACVLRYNGLADSSVDGYRLIAGKRYKNRKCESNHLLRYLSYLDKILDRENLHFCNALRLKQIIITKVPQMSENGCMPIFKIFKEQEELDATASKSLMDENYIITEFDKIQLKGDVKIMLYHQDNHNKHLIFELGFNTVFMKQGLYRFTVEDIYFPFSEAVIERKIGKEFLVDVALIDSEISEKIIYNIECNHIDNLRILSRHLNNVADQFNLRTLIKLGYNRIYARVLLQLGCNNQEIKDKLEILNRTEFGLVKRGSSIAKEADKKIIFQDYKEAKTIADTRKICEQAYLKKPFHKIEYNSNVDLTTSEIDLIPESFIHKNNEKKITKGPPTKFFKKSSLPKNDTKDQKETNTNIVVKYPLHWQPLNMINNTIFNDLENIEINFDKEKFEEWFCEPATFKKTQKVERKQTILNDEKRIFLVSIALKTLEKRKLDTEDLQQLIYENFYILDYEDLQNIMRVLPTKTEVDKYNAYIKSGKCNLENLNEVEQFLFTHTDYVDLKKIVEILIFERKFTEEFIIIEKEIKDFKNLFDAIFNSNNLRIILKSVLILGNLINFRYSKNRFKKKAVGFKIMSLHSFLSYKSLKKENSIISYLYLTLKQQKSSIFDIFKEFSLLNRLKNEDMIQIKDKINKMILQFRECKFQFNFLDEEEEVIQQMNRFLGFVFEKLKTLSDQYKEIVFLSSVIKRKFGENEKESISSILTALSDFLSRLYEEHVI